MKKIITRTSKILLAVISSIVFCYLTFRGVDLAEVFEFVSNANYAYMTGALLTVIAAQIMRSLRWGVMLHPIEPLRQGLLFPISSIGFMFITLIPARLGEIARPYLLHHNSRVNMSTAMATVILERILDALCIVILFGAIVGSLELPVWIIQGSVYLITFMVAIIALLFLGRFKWINMKINLLIHKVLPQGLANIAETMMEKFYQGMGVLGKGRHALLIIALTAGIWGGIVLYNALLFKAFQIPLGSFAALTVLALTALGVSMPAGPGFIGNYHFFCILALTVFGIDKDIGLSYAIVNHALLIGTVILLGIICLNIPGLNFGLKYLKSLYGKSSAN